MTFKDLFSSGSNDYARFRPLYPRALFEYLSRLCATHELAWDCATGNGQAAIELARYFKRVVATDASAQQLQQARVHPSVHYQVAKAEEAPFEKQVVDLITVAQAFHWFQHEAFFAEVKRVLKPNGVLAIWAYELCTVSPEIDAVVIYLYNDLLGPLWEKERRFIEEGYQNNIFPLREIAAPPFVMEAYWSFDHFVGYLSTWSPIKKYREKYGQDPIMKIIPRLQGVWGNVEKRDVRWKLALRVGRN